jgi:uncharacterized protein (TIGR03118 family)
MHTWVRSFQRLFGVASSPRLACRRRPTFDQLEDRCVPATGYTQLNLVSDQANTALLTDTNLVNAWGIALDPQGGDFWVADNGTNVATLYAGDAAGSPFIRDPLVVTIPFGSPTGQVFNSSSDFKVTNGTNSSPAQFLFAQETPWAAGWNQGTSAQAVIDTVGSGAVYKGLALAQNGTANLLYLANFNAGTVEVYDTNFRRDTNLPGNFTDPNLPAGYAPFNIVNLSGQLYVSYAVQDATKQDPVAGEGNGIIDVFNPDGSFVKRLVSNGTGSPLNSPWGMTVAPNNFGDLSGDLLVGNFGDGVINAFNPSTGDFVSTLNDAAGHPIVIDGVWGLQFGNGSSAGDSNVLYFAAGPGSETHGLFGSLRANGTNPLTGTGTTVIGTAGAPLPGVLATFNDATPGMTFTVTITVSGHSSLGNVTPAGSGFLVTGPGTNPEAGASVPVNIVIKETANPSNTLTINSTATVAPNPLQPVGQNNPTITNPNEDTFSGNLVSFSDSNVAAQTTDFTAAITWGDGTSNGGTVGKNADGTFTVSGTDPSTEDGSFPSNVVVHDNATNHSLTMQFTYVVNEPLLSGVGQAASTDATGVFNNATLATFTHGTNSERPGAFEATINWGDSSTPTAGTVSSGPNGYVVRGSHTYTSSGTFNVSIAVTDDAASTTIDTTTTVAAPGNPLAAVGPTNPTITNPNEGSFSGNLVSFSDTNAAAMAPDFTATTVAFGDGTSTSGIVTKNADGTFTVAVANVTVEDGSFPSTVTVRDSASHTLPIPFTYVVSEPALTGTGQQLAPSLAGVFSKVTLVTFAHGNNSEPATAFQASIDWGDHNTSAGTVAATSNGYTVQGSHTYSTPGTFNVAVTIADDRVSSSFKTTAVVPVGTPITPPPTHGEIFVAKVFQDLGLTVEAATQERLAAELDKGTSANQVALDLIQSLGKSFRTTLRKFTGGGSTTKQAQRLFLHFVGHNPDPKADKALLRSIAKKLSKPKTANQALALLLSSSQFLAEL